MHEHAIYDLTKLKLSFIESTETNEFIQFVKMSDLISYLVTDDVYKNQGNLICYGCSSFKKKSNGSPS